MTCAELVSVVREALPVIKEVIVTIAAVIGSFVAILGLKTWRRQLRGASKYEVTRRTMKALRSVHAAVQEARNALTSAGAIRYYLAQGKSLPSNEPLDLEGVERRSLDRYASARAVLREQAAEVRDVLGEEAGDKVTGVLKMVGLFDINVGLLSLKDSDAPPTDPREKPNVLYVTGDDDKYGKDLDRMISDALDYFRKLL
jgi:hypothetical protein